MKTAISIPDPLFHAAERLARRLGMSRSELFQHAVRTFLQAQRDAGVTEELNRIYAADWEDSRLDPLLERMQLASLAAEEW